MWKKLFLILKNLSFKINKSNINFKLAGFSFLISIENKWLREIGVTYLGFKSSELNQFPDFIHKFFLRLRTYYRSHSFFWFFHSSIQSFCINFLHFENLLQRFLCDLQVFCDQSNTLLSLKVFSVASTSNLLIFNQRLRHLSHNRMA
jgi:hypothetical protein